jgi:hypothetical protein
VTSVIQVISQQGRLAWQPITGYGLRNYAELAMQRYKRILGNTMKARAAASENRGMDQCGCTEPNDQSRHAGVRESLEDSEHRRALLSFFFIQQHPVMKPGPSFCSHDCTSVSGLSDGLISISDREALLQCLLPEPLGSSRQGQSPYSSNDDVAETAPFTSTSVSNILRAQPSSPMAH